MKISTLAYLFKEDKILLGMKKRAFGEGKWNGYGGKVEKGELPIDAVLREIEEECGVIIQKEACRELGYIDFFFDDKKEWDQRVVVYRIDDFVDEPEETEEMKPKWFDVRELPYEQMWKSDDVWLTNVIEMKKFSGEIHLGNNGERVLSFKMF